MTLASFLDPVLLVATLMIAVPAVTLLTEVLAALWQRGAAPECGRDTAKITRGRIAVVVPAHNEAAGVGRTIAGLLPQIAAGDRLVVVADNCTDRTAELARAAGASVIERRDEERRGKGFALDFGVDWLRADPPDCVVFIDADCTMAPGSLERLHDACAGSGRPAQALNLCHVPQGITRMGPRIAEFAFLVKNHVRPRGLARLGLPCALTGTGMAFPWSLIAAAPLASDHLAEDMMLGSTLAAQGHAPLFVEAARVDSEFPSSEDGERGQRRRWEHGHLQTLLTRVPSLALSAISQRAPVLLAHALDLAVPPLALLLALQLLLVAATSTSLLLGGGALALAISLASLAATGIAVLLAWYHFGRSILSASMLWMAPIYVLRKLPLYIGFLGSRQSAWMRARRDGE
ncbi:MAG: glycosyltransferase family 2 protein [Burkholderiaceae bacterium]